ncbi:hypothetical protein L1887_51341 [Cichorium endivia]|nr:hypothetical protein L1887_51341 [Cichorium endivia]
MEGDELHPESTERVHPEIALQSARRGMPARAEMELAGWAARHPHYPRPDPSPKHRHDHAIWSASVFSPLGANTASDLQAGEMRMAWTSQAVESTCASSMCLSACFDVGSGITVNRIFRRDALQDASSCANCVALGTAEAQAARQPTPIGCVASVVTGICTELSPLANLGCALGRPDWSTVANLVLLAPCRRSMRWSACRFGGSVRWMSRAGGWNRAGSMAENFYQISQLPAAPSGTKISPGKMHWVAGFDRERVTERRLEAVAVYVSATSERPHGESTLAWMWTMA